MKSKTLLMLLLLDLFFGCQEEKKLDNPDQLKQVLLSYFDGIKNIDLDEMNAVTTNDYLLFENGQVWNNDSIYNFLKALPPFVAVYTLDNFRINIDTETGNIVYYNHADLTMNDTTEIKYDWIESATFKKIDGEWKIDFLHSTVRQ